MRHIYIVKGEETRQLGSFILLMKDPGLTSHTVLVDSLSFDERTVETSVCLLQMLDQLESTGKAGEKDLPSGRRVGAIDETVEW